MTTYEQGFADAEALAIAHGLGWLLEVRPRNHLVERQFVNRDQVQSVMLEPDGEGWVVILLDDSEWLTTEEWLSK